MASALGRLASDPGHPLCGSALRMRMDCQIGHWPEKGGRRRRLRTDAESVSLKGLGVDDEQQVGVGSCVTSRWPSARTADEFALDAHQVDDGLRSRVAWRRVKGQGLRLRLCGDHCGCPRCGMAAVRCDRTVGYCGEPVNRRCGYPLAGLGHDWTGPATRTAGCGGKYEDQTDQPASMLHEPSTSYHRCWFRAMIMSIPETAAILVCSVFLRAPRSAPHSYS